MSVQSHQKELILASTSPYRRALLNRLRIPFLVHAPDVDESPLPGELAPALTQRLALLKATHIAADFPDAVVIGSDQAAEFAGRIIGKPDTEAVAVGQLLGFSGRTVKFHTATAVICLGTGFSQHALDSTEVKFRELAEDEVRRYIALDQPFDCAGAFKAEAAGPVLMQSMSTRDPTAIIGLPLIALAGMLRAAGFHLP
jgi:septum formation protein